MFMTSSNFVGCLTGRSASADMLRTFTPEPRPAMRIALSAGISRARRSC
jgi:hypothetical protein